MQLNKGVKITRVMNAVAAGTTVQTGSSVDMRGFEGVLFLAAFGTITATAVTGLKAAQSSDDSSFDDLAGTLVAIADDDDNQLLALDVYKPRDRFVRPVVNRATANAVIDGVFAIQYGPRTEPTTHDATTVAASEAHVSPAEGTA